MKVQDIHQRYFQQSVFLTRAQVRNAILPPEIIKLFNENGIRFVLVGAHGIAGWLKTPRATLDVDLVVAERSLKKAIRLLTKSYPHLEPVELDVVVRLKDRTTGDVLIDLMKPRDLYSQAFKHTHEMIDEDLTFRVPTLEMAVTMKFAAMISPNRAEEKKYQDAHDFLVMVKGHQEIDADELRHLGSFVYGQGGDELLEMIRRVRAGERLIL